jgi:hypothetical protein
MRMGCVKAFRMELDRGEPWEQSGTFRPKLGAFDDAVGRTEGDPERVGQSVDGLVMRAVHSQSLGAVNGRCLSVWDNIDGVDRLESAVHLGMRDITGTLRGKIDIERSAEGHVDELMPSANGQQRLGATEQFVQQGQFHHVAVRFWELTTLQQIRGDLGPVELGMDVVAAGQQDSVRPFQVLAQTPAMSQLGQSQRKASGLQDRLQVPAAHADGVIGKLRAGGVSAGRHQNDRAAHKRHSVPKSQRFKRETLGLF